MGFLICFGNSSSGLGEEIRVVFLNENVNLVVLLQGLFGPLENWMRKFSFWEFSLHVSVEEDLFMVLGSLSPTKDWFSIGVSNLWKVSMISLIGIEDFHSWKSSESIRGLFTHESCVKGTSRAWIAVNGVGYFAFRGKTIYAKIDLILWVFFKLTSHSYVGWSLLGPDYSENFVRLKLLTTMVDFTSAKRWPKANLEDGLYNGDGIYIKVKIANQEHKVFDGSPVSSVGSILLSYGHWGFSALYGFVFEVFDVLHQQGMWDMSRPGFAGYFTVMMEMMMMLTAQLQGGLGTVRFEIMFAVNVHLSLNYVISRVVSNGGGDGLIETDVVMKHDMGDSAGTFGHWAAGRGIGLIFLMMAEVTGDLLDVHTDGGCNIVNLIGFKGQVGTEGCILQQFMRGRVNYPAGFLCAIFVRSRKFEDCLSKCYDKGSHQDTRTNVDVVNSLQIKELKQVFPYFEVLEINRRASSFVALRMVKEAAGICLQGDFVNLQMVRFTDDFNDEDTGAMLEWDEHQKAIAGIVMVNPRGMIYQGKLCRVYREEDMLGLGDATASEVGVLTEVITLDDVIGKSELLKKSGIIRIGKTWKDWLVGLAKVRPLKNYLQVMRFLTQGCYGFEEIGPGEVINEKNMRKMLLLRADCVGHMGLDPPGVSRRSRGQECDDKDKDAGVGREATPKELNSWHRF